MLREVLVVKTPEIISLSPLSQSPLYVYACPKIDMKYVTGY